MAAAQEGYLTGLYTRRWAAGLEAPRRPSQQRQGEGEGRECPALFTFLPSSLEELEGDRAGQEPEGVDALFSELCWSGAELSKAWRSGAP